MTDDVYRDLPPDLTALLRDPSVILPGELETFDRVHKWTVTPVVGNAPTVTSLPPGNYLHGAPPQSTTPPRNDTVPA